MTSFLPRCARLFRVIASPRLRERALSVCPGWSLRAGMLFVALSAAPHLLQASEIEEKLNALIEQNAELLRLAQAQQAEIILLKSRLDSMESETVQTEQAIEELQSVTDNLSDIGPRRSSGGNRRVIFSGEAGFAFFSGQENGIFPNEEFRVDDARFFVEAEIARDIYFVSSLELFRREARGSEAQVGELYVDFENVFNSNNSRLATLRLGLFATPFGEEYQNRYVMENPLISHSLSDLWGIDEGIELYGELDRFTYAVAIQNGGTSILRDFDSDKSISARLGLDPTNNLHLSASIMRTGDIDITGDKQSEMWIGNVVFQSIGSAQTTRFGAELAEIDGSWSWESGKIEASIGRAWYDDNDPARDNSRDFDFYHIEARQDLVENVYAAARYSVMDIDDGYPIAGHGARGPYAFGSLHTEYLRRLSLGLGYWPLSDMLLKLEYTIEDGDHTNGSSRDGTDQLAAEMGVRF